MECGLTTSRGHGSALEIQSLGLSLPASTLLDLEHVASEAPAFRRERRSHIFSASCHEDVDYRCNRGRDQHNNYNQAWASISREEPEHLSSVAGCQECQQRVPYNSAQGKREEKSFHGIFHRACDEEKWKQGHWRRQKGGNRNRAESPSAETSPDLLERRGRELAFERFLSSLSGNPIGYIGSNHRTNRRHRRIVKP